MYNFHDRNLLSSQKNHNSQEIDSNNGGFICLDIDHWSVKGVDVVGTGEWQTCYIYWHRRIA